MTIQDMVHLLLFVVMFVIGAALLLSVGLCIYVLRLRWPDTKKNNKMGESAKTDVRLMGACAVIFILALCAIVWMLGQAAQDWEVLGWV